MPTTVLDMTIKLPPGASLVKLEGMLGSFALARKGAMRSIVNGRSDIFPRNDKSILDTSSSSRYKKSSPNDLLSLLLRLRQMSRLTSAHQSAGLYSDAMAGLGSPF